MPEHLVLVGGGHAHLTTLVNLSDLTGNGYKVTLISPSRYHYYSGMGPGMLSGLYRPEEVRFNVRRMAEERGAFFIEEKVERIDIKSRRLFLSSGRELAYDVVSFNVGSEISYGSFSFSGDNVFPVKPIVNLLRGKLALLDLMKKGRPKVIVVGGGAAGLEVAGNTWSLAEKSGQLADITLLTSGTVLSRFPRKARRLALSSLEKRRITVMEETPLKAIENNAVVLEKKERLSFDVAFLAVGIKPPPIFMESGLPAGPDGGLLVNSYLQSVASPEIFGGGDCISLKGYSLDKVGVYAVRQNPILWHNLNSAMRGGTLEHFDPGGEYLLIFNLGNGRGIFRRRNLVANGRLPFLLKQRIDRRFMKKYGGGARSLPLSY